MTAHQVGSYGPFMTSEHYEIRVKGHLGARWSAWFDGLRVVNEDDAITVISGSVPDQAALHGLLQKLRDVGIPLVSVVQVSPPPPTEGN